MALSDPTKLSPMVANMAPDWQLIRDVRAGARQMRDAGTTYLPKFASELDDDEGYQRRVAVTPWSGHYEDATRSLVGKPFSKEVVLQGEVPTQITEFAENIDAAGSNLHNFAREVFEDGVHLGMHLILVDFVNVEGATSRGDERRAGARPFLRHIPADTLVQFHTAVRDGQRYLRRIRFRDDEIELNEQTGDEETVERVRQLDDVDGVVTSTVWSKRNDSWVQGDPVTLTLNVIPVVVINFGPQLASGIMSKPPMLDLAYKQVDHFQASSGLRNTLDSAGFPMLQAKGMVPAEDEEGNVIPVIVGPRSVLYSAPSTEGASALPEWGYIAPNPGIIKELRDNLKDIEAEIRLLGLQPVMPTTGLQNMAATTTAVNAARAHSAVQAWALHLKDGLENALLFMARYLGLPETTEISVHTDFAAEVLSDADERLLLEMASLGYISRQTLWDELTRRDILGPSFSSTDEENRLLSDDDGLGLGAADDVDDIAESLAT